MKGREIHVQGVFPADQERAKVGCNSFAVRHGQFMPPWSQVGAPRVKPVAVSAIGLFLAGAARSTPTPGLVRRGQERPPGSQPPVLYLP